MRIADVDDHAVRRLLKIKDLSEVVDRGAEHLALETVGRTRPPGLIVLVKRNRCKIKMPDSTTPMAIFCV